MLVIGGLLPGGFVLRKQRKGQLRSWSWDGLEPSGSARSVSRGRRRGALLILVEVLRNRPQAAHIGVGPRIGDWETQAGLQAPPVCRCYIRVIQKGRLPGRKRPDLLALLALRVSSRRGRHSPYDAFASSDHLTFAIASRRTDSGMSFLYTRCDVPSPSCPVSSSTITAETCAAYSFVVTPCRNEW